MQQHISRYKYLQHVHWPTANLVTLNPSNVRVEIPLFKNSRSGNYRDIDFGNLFQSEIA
jgi:hypothetical protein